MILAAILLGGFSVPLLIANFEEKTIMLGIGYAWMTLPITVGSVLLVVRAGLSLLARLVARDRASATVVRRRLAAVLRAAARDRRASAAALLLPRRPVRRMVAAGVPVGFVLAPSASRACRRPGPPTWWRW